LLNKKFKALGKNLSGKFEELGIAWKKLKTNRDVLEYEGIIKFVAILL